MPAAIRIVTVRRLDVFEVRSWHHEYALFSCSIMLAISRIRCPFAISMKSIIGGWKDEMLSQPLRPDWD